MSAGGKGDTPRPYSVPLEEFDNNWDRIFKKKHKDDPKDHDPKEDQNANTKD